MRPFICLLTLFLVVTAHAQPSLEPVHHYAIENQVMAIYFLAGKNIVAAHVVYEGKPLSNPRPATGNNPPILRERLTTFAAFDRQTEKELWRRDDVASVFSATFAGDSLAILFIHKDTAKPILALLDPATGKSLAQIELKGQPRELRYCPASKTLTFANPLDPQSTGAKDVTFDLLGFTADKLQPAWSTHLESHQLTFLATDDKQMDLIAYGQLMDHSMIAIEASSGKILWKKPLPLGRIPPADLPTADKDQPLPPCFGYGLNAGNVCGLIRLSDGQLFHSFPLKAPLGQPPIPLSDGRFFLIYRSGSSIPWNVVRATDGFELWQADDFNPHVRPLQWNNKLVLYGSELRIYHDAGKLLIKITSSTESPFNPSLAPQVVGDELIIAEQKRFTSYRYVDR